MTLVQFDDQYEVNYEFKDLKDVPFLDKTNYQPRGLTALLDAVGKLINEAGKQLAAMSEKDRPKKVLFVIQTDGQENASREFSRAKIIEMLTHQQEVYHWQVVYLGANQDAIQGARDLGINTQNAMTYQHTGAGVQAAAASYSANLSAFRSGNAVSMAFTDADRKRQQHTSHNPH